MKIQSNRHADTYFRGHHFLRDVGVVTIRELEPLGLVPDDFLVDFHPDRLAELQYFCHCNPEFHIVSFMPTGVMFNRATAGASWFMLADGDSNPRLVAKDIYGLRFLSGASDHPFPPEGDEL